MTCRFLYLVGKLGFGGLERQLFYLLQAMDRDRYKPAVAVWRFDEGDPYVSRIRAIGVPLYPLSCGESPAKKILSFRKLTGELKPEIVHSWSFYTNFAVKWASVGLKAIPLGSIRNDFTWERHNNGKVLSKLSGRWPRAQICNSLAAKNSVMRYHGFFKPASLFVVRNGLDIEKFRFEPVLPSQPKLLAVGRLSSEKRWDRLLNLIASAVRGGKTFVVDHVGDGPLREQLELQAIDLGVDGRIRFLGHRNNIQELLAMSTFLIHTADHEGCPNIVMEAMACGRAVIATDAGDVSFLVENGKTGYVVPRGDHEKLLDCVTTLLEDPGLCRQMGKAGRAKAEREFGLDYPLSELLSAYRAVGFRD